MKYFGNILLFLCSLALLSVHEIVAAEEMGIETASPAVSPQTQACIGCHAIYTPGIVKDWESSRHARTTPSDALKKPGIERRISSSTVPGGMEGYTVGCYECHSLNPENHKDNFAHMGQKINVIVTPNDCAKCHPVESGQFAGSKKSYAHKILMENAVYRTLVETTTGITRFDNANLALVRPSDMTLHETCLGCHGTEVKVRGTKSVSARIGPVEIPDLINWPNQGVGRINPDGSRGSCAACHARHGFMVEVARKPYTCSQCHHEPDVPAWDVYEESKHGNIYASKGKDWNFTNVPWKVGQDIKAPTCATCHNSLLVSPDNTVIAERTHDFGSRLWVRLFGLIYSTPQPKWGDTTVMKNKDGLPLPATFTNEHASEYLIDKAEQEKRIHVVSSICNSCHSSSWVQGHFSKLDNTIKETDEMTLTATKLLIDVWGKGIADRTNPFDEAIEQMWIRQWLFYANSIRYASAMTGAPDYSSFKNGWWYMNENLRHMKDWMEFKKDTKGKD